MTRRHLFTTAAGAAIATVCPASLAPAAPVAVQYPTTYVPMQFRLFRGVEQVFVPSIQKDDGTWGGRWEPISYLQQFSDAGCIP